HGIHEIAQIGRRIQLHETVRSADGQYHILALALEISHIIPKVSVTLDAGINRELNLRRGSCLGLREGNVNDVKVGRDISQSKWAGGIPEVMPIAYERVARDNPFVRAWLGEGFAAGPTQFLGTR